MPASISSESTFETGGGTEHLTNTIYHGGLTADLAAQLLRSCTKKIASRECFCGFFTGR